MKSKKPRSCSERSALLPEEQERGAALRASPGEQRSSSCWRGAAEGWWGLKSAVSRNFKGYIQYV